MEYLFSNAQIITRVSFQSNDFFAAFPFHAASYFNLFKFQAIIFYFLLYSIYLSGSPFDYRFLYSRCFLMLALPLSSKSPPTCCFCALSAKDSQSEDR